MYGFPTFVHGKIYKLKNYKIWKKKADRAKLKRVRLNVFWAPPTSALFKTAVYIPKTVSFEVQITACLTLIFIETFRSIDLIL